MTLGPRRLALPASGHAEYLDLRGRPNSVKEAEPTTDWAVHVLLT